MELSDVALDVFDALFVITSVSVKASTCKTKQSSYGKTDDGNSANFKQLKLYIDYLKITLRIRICSQQQKRSYYNEIFENYFDMLDPNS